MWQCIALWCYHQGTTHSLDYHFLIMSRKDLAQRFRYLMETEGYSFKEDYQQIAELWRDYIDFMLELGNITPAKYSAVYDHYWQLTDCPPFSPQAPISCILKESNKRPHATHQLSLHCWLLPRSIYCWWGCETFHQTCYFPFWLW